MLIYIIWKPHCFISVDVLTLYFSLENLASANLDVLFCTKIFYMYLNISVCYNDGYHRPSSRHSLLDCVKNNQGKNPIPYYINITMEIIDIYTQLFTDKLNKVHRMSERLNLRLNISV